MTSPVEEATTLENVVATKPFPTITNCIQLVQKANTWGFCCKKDRFQHLNIEEIIYTSSSKQAWHANTTQCLVM